jgi:hypothetical protein
LKAVEKLEGTGTQKNKQKDRQKGRQTARREESAESFGSETPAGT